MMRNNIIALLDIGNSKVVCIIIRLGNNTCKLLGMSIHASQGFKSGMITDVALAEHSIISVITEAEKQAKQHIEAIFINIANPSINSQYCSSSLTIDSKQVTDKHVHEIIKKSTADIEKTSVEILHKIILSYSLDDTSNIDNPVAMFGNDLSAYIHVVTSTEQPVMNTAHCLSKCRVEISDLIVSSYASALACSTESEQQQGILLIDIGAHMTDFAIIKHGKLCYAGSIPIAGYHITSDIAKCLAIDWQQAEYVKIKYGDVSDSSCNSHNIIRCTTDPNIDSDLYADELNIDTGILSEIIRARLDEIYEMVAEKLINNKYQFSYIALTGASANLAGLIDLTRKTFNVRVRLGHPMLDDIDIENLKDEDILLDQTQYATIIGMIKFVKNQANIQQNLTNNEASGKFGKIKKIFKVFF